MKIALNWQISSFFGWGVYGLNLALEWANDPTIEACAHIGKLDDVVVDRLRRRALMPFVLRSVQPSPADAIMVDALGNGAVGGGDRAKIAAIFLEEPLTADAVEKLKRYDTIVAGSTWNACVLKESGIENVVTIFQGVDRSLFHPAPKRGLYPGKFLIFSGGKAEPRKGQDLVVKAFRIFAKNHPEALLVTAWHSPWHRLANGMDLDLSEVADQVIDVGAVPNAEMAPIYRECDVALFPNRCEGGTNLVAMETIACGIPTILSAGTGHCDLLELPGTIGLSHRHSRDHWGEWCEASVDEIIATLEMAHRILTYREREPLDPKFFSWRVAANKLAALARNQEVTDVRRGQESAA